MRASKFDKFCAALTRATPIERVQIERAGMPARLIKDMSARLDVPAVRMYSMLGLPRATVEKKASADEVVSGSGGQAAIGMVKLIALATEIVSDRRGAEKESFDAARWLGEWIERPQPALGGLKPSELLDTPTGLALVSRVLGAAQSGSYQ